MASLTPAGSLSPAPHPSSSKPSFQPGPPRRPPSPASCSGHPAPGPRLTQHPVPSSCAPGQHRCLPRSPPPRHRARGGGRNSLLGSVGPRGRDKYSAAQRSGAHREEPLVPGVPSFRQIRRERQDVTGVSPKLASAPRPAHPLPTPLPPREDGAAVPKEGVAQEQFIRVPHLPGQRIRQIHAAPPSLRRNQALSTPWFGKSHQIPSAEEASCPFNSLDISVAVSL